MQQIGLRLSIAGGALLVASAAIADPLPLRPRCTDVMPGPAIDGDDAVGWYLVDRHLLDVPRQWHTVRVYAELESYGFCDAKIAAPTTESRSVAIGDAIGPYRVSSGFGPRPKPCAGCSTYHAGIDVATPPGVALITPAAVTVACRYDRNGGGNVAEFWYAGILHQWLHLSECFPGDRPLGDVFAVTGASGLGTGPHLDYRVKEAGQRVYPPVEVLAFALNPYDFME